MPATTILPIIMTWHARTYEPNATQPNFDEWSLGTWDVNVRSVRSSAQKCFDFCVWAFAHGCVHIAFIGGTTESI